MQIREVAGPVKARTAVGRRTGAGVAILVPAGWSIGSPGARSAGLAHAVRALTGPATPAVPEPAVPGRASPRARFRSTGTECVNRTGMERKRAIRFAQVVSCQPLILTGGGLRWRPTERSLRRGSGHALRADSKDGRLARARRSPFESGRPRAPASPQGERFCSPLRNLSEADSP